jgi:hypothetical protein
MEATHCEQPSARRCAGWLVFVLALAPRLLQLDQPLLENFIDRQCHTAMIARNLLRGGLVLYPEIDIGPFPGYYMLEFPAYQCLVVGLCRLLPPLPLDAAGRLVSAVATAVACWLLYRLVQARYGPGRATLAGLALAAMPVTLRFGRAFQPDALLMALVLGCIHEFDRWSRSGRRVALMTALVALGLALLVKATVAYVVLVCGFLAWQRLGWNMVRRRQVWLALLLVLAPAAGWYAHAWSCSAGSPSGTFWGVAKWLAPERFLRADTYVRLAYFTGWRMLGPLQAVLALGGAVAWWRRERDGLVLAWLAALTTFLPVLVRKLDHEHYYLAFAPLAALFAARGIGGFVRGLPGVVGPAARVALASLLFAAGLVTARSTFRTPSEWAHVPDAARALRGRTPPRSLVVAHASVLFYADRRGFPVAHDSHDVQYLLGTWDVATADPEPRQLVEFYARRGAAYLLELRGTTPESRHPQYFRWLAARLPVIEDRPGQFLLGRVVCADPAVGN